MHEQGFHDHINDRPKQFSLFVHTRRIEAIKSTGCVLAIYLSLHYSDMVDKLHSLLIILLITIILLNAPTLIFARPHNRPTKHGLYTKHSNNQPNRHQ